MLKGGLCLVSNPARSESSAAKLTKRAKDFSSSALSLSCVSPPANESQNPGRVNELYWMHHVFSAIMINHVGTRYVWSRRYPSIDMKKEQMTEELICNLSKLTSFDFRLTCRSLSCFSLI